MEVTAPLRVLTVHLRCEPRVIVMDHLHALTQEPRRIQNLSHAHVKEWRRSLAPHRRAQILLRPKRGGETEQPPAVRMQPNLPEPLRQVGKPEVFRPFHPALLFVRIIRLEPMEVNGYIVCRDAGYYPSVPPIYFLHC